MAAVTYSPQKFKKAYQSIWYKLLPSLCVNRNITKEYRMLPLRYQGLALPNPNIARLSKKIHLLQVLHWDTGSTVERMLHQAYQVFQGGRLVQSFEVFCLLATHGFFRNLWELLHRYGAIFRLHADFDIPLLRSHDCTLMDAIHDTGIFTGCEEETINRYCHYKGVHCIGDMVCSDGLTIDPDMQTQEPGQSTCEFPSQHSTKSDHALWTKVITSMTQPGQKLCQPLGSYISVPHLPDVWFESNTLSSLYLKVETRGHNVFTINPTLRATRYGATYTYSHYDDGPCPNARRVNFINWRGPTVQCHSLAPAWLPTQVYRPNRLLATLASWENSSSWKHLRVDGGIRD